MPDRFNSTRAYMVGADLGMELASKLWDTHVIISYWAVKQIPILTAKM